MTALSLYEIKKYGIDRICILADKIYHGQSLKTIDQKYIKIDSLQYEDITITVGKSTHRQFENRLIKFFDKIPNKARVTINNRYNLGYLLKSEDFGGEPKGNQGNKFEDDVYRNLITRTGKYKELIDFINKYKINTISNSAGYKPFRPLIIKNKSIVSGLIDSECDLSDVGNAVADIQLYTKYRRINLSLKYGNRISLINNSIIGLIPVSSYRTGKFSDNAKKLLEFFGIDTNKFRSSFTRYKGTSIGCDEIVDVSNSVNIYRIRKFISSVIGTNYYMVHFYKGLSIKRIDSTVNADWSNINRVKVIYPKNNCKKQVEVRLVGDKVDFVISFRNTRGGILPSHLLCYIVFKEGR